MDKLISNINLLVNSLKEQESKLRANAIFLQEHNFNKEKEWVSMKLDLIQEIRYEVELSLSEKEFNPKFKF